MGDSKTSKVVVVVLLVEGEVILVVLLVLSKEGYFELGCDSDES